MGLFDKSLESFAKDRQKELDRLNAILADKKVMDNLAKDLENKIKVNAENQKRVDGFANDLEQYKARKMKEVEDEAKFGAQSLILSLLPALDNLERSLKVSANGDDAKRLQSEVEAIKAEFLAELKKHGVEAIDAKGAMFDPYKHQAVQQFDMGMPSGTILDDFQTGYILNERVIRPSMVVVQL